MPDKAIHRKVSMTNSKRALVAHYLALAAFARMNNHKPGHRSYINRARDAQHDVEYNYTGKECVAYTVGDYHFTAKIRPGKGLP